MEEATGDMDIKTGSITMGPQTLALNTHKAGMEGLDARKINEIIKKASEGSKFYIHKLKCQQRLDAKISEMMKMKSLFTEQQINKAVLQMDHLIDELEQERDLTRTIVHVDMDMFYAAVEMRDDPSLRDKPMAVGSTGMLSTSNYAARKFGVRAAMPGFIAKKLCPELIIVPPNFTKYKECSKAVQEVFAEYDPNFSPMSLDEAYLDITDYIKRNYNLYVEDTDDDMNNQYVAECIVKEMRKKIQVDTKLTASAGIAANTRLAKVCSDLNKPDGQFYLPPDKQKILDFVAALPIRKVSGIGNVTEQQLSSLGIKVCSDLLRKRGLLKLLFTDLNYNCFIHIALGLGSTTLEARTERDRKSISTETTFRGTADKEFLLQQCEELCQELAEDLLEKDIFGKVFTLKIKTTDFKLKTKAHSFIEATRSCESLVSAARRLLHIEIEACSPPPLSLRLIGVRMSSLVNSSEVGPSRQVTLMHLFSKAGQSKTQQRVMPSQVAYNTSSTQSIENNFNLKNEHLKLNSSCNVLRNAQEESNTIIQKDDLNISKRKEHSKSVLTKSYNSIDNYFCKAGKTPDYTKSNSFECPVCYEQVQMSSIAKFNIHVDNCLIFSTTKDSPPSSEDNCLRFSKTKDSSPSSEVVSDYIPEDSSVKAHTAVRKKISVSQKDEMGSLNNDKDNDEKNLANSCYREYPSIEDVYGKVKEPDGFSCPVCKQAGFTHINQLNSHIDECLSMGTIKKIISNMQLEHVPQNQRHQKVSEISSFSELHNSHNEKDGVQTLSQARKKQKSSHNTLHKYFSS